MGQSETRFSQYMFAQGIINPAYNSISEKININLITRLQWANINGAPQVSAMNLSYPVSRRAAMGVLFLTDRVGVTDTDELSFTYAYKLPVGKSYAFKTSNKFISFGLTAGVSFNQLRFSELVLNDPNDPVFANDLNINSPKFGFGIMYYSEKMMFGISTPSLTSRQLSSQNANFRFVNDLSWNGTFQYFFKTNADFGYKASMFLRLEEGRPLQVDTNLSLLYKELIWFGVGYSSNNAIIAYIDLKLTSTMNVSYSMDYLSFQDEFLRNARGHEIRLAFTIDRFGSRNRGSYSFQVF